MSLRCSFFFFLGAIKRGRQTDSAFVSLWSARPRQLVQRRLDGDRTGSEEAAESERWFSFFGSILRHKRFWCCGFSRILQRWNASPPVKGPTISFLTGRQAMIYCSLAKTVRKGKREREKESKRVNKEKISCPDSYSFYPRKRFVSYITISLVMTSAMGERKEHRGRKKFSLSFECCNRRENSQEDQWTTSLGIVVTISHGFCVSKPPGGFFLLGEIGAHSISASAAGGMCEHHIVHEGCRVV